MYINMLLYEEDDRLSWRRRWRRTHLEHRPAGPSSTAWPEARHPGGGLHWQASVHGVTSSVMGWLAWFHCHQQSRSSGSRLADGRTAGCGVTGAVARRANQPRPDSARQKLIGRRTGDCSLLTKRPSPAPSLHPRQLLLQSLQVPFRFLSTLACAVVQSCGAPFPSQCSKHAHEPSRRSRARELFPPQPPDPPSHPSRDLPRPLPPPKF